MLGALGPGLMTGVIREVILAETGAPDFTASVAEETGAALVVAPDDPGAAAAAAAAQARADWLLLLAPDAALAPDWPEAVLRHAASAPSAAAWAPVAGGGLAARLADILWSAGRPVGERCLLVPRGLWEAPGALAGPRPSERLGRRAGLRRLARLATTAG